MHIGEYDAGLFIRVSRAVLCAIRVRVLFANNILLQHFYGSCLCCNKRH